MSFANLSDGQREQLQASAARSYIGQEVLAECDRQVTLWGVQRRPAYTDMDALDHAERFPYSVLDTSLAKSLCDFKMQDGTASWQDIIAEEFMEARDEAKKGDLSALRVELIQLAAVIISAIQDIDRTEAENA